MLPDLTTARVDTLPSLLEPSFSVRRSREIPTYCELALEDAQGSLAHWVIPMPLKHLAKRPMLLWLLAETPQLDSLACVETGAMQLAGARPNAATTLRTELAHGMLRLYFQGEMLRGYYRLQCLPTGCGQLWQLTPIGHV